jgi:cell wall-associated NlpC family hydrolase
MLDRRRFLQAGFSFFGLCSGSIRKTERFGPLSPQTSRMIVVAARRMIGTPYAPGAISFPDGTDCSRLTQWCYASAGLAIPRTARAQYTACTRASASPGALLFFTEVPAKSLISHVGIHSGAGRMVSTSRRARAVTEERWSDSPYWITRFLGSATL